MSLTSGFFDSFNEDRKYNSLQFSSIFDGIISDGIYATYGDYFLVSPVSGMNIKVGTGRAWLDHTWTLNDADYPLTVEDAEVVLKRIDTVIIEIVNGNYYDELETKKRYRKDSEIPIVQAGWVIYIFIMCLLIIFKDAWIGWIAATLYFFNWRSKKIKEEYYYD